MHEPTRGDIGVEPLRSAIDLLKMATTAPGELTALEKVVIGDLLLSLPAMSTEPLDQPTKQALINFGAKAIRAGIEELPEDYLWVLPEVLGEDYAKPESLTSVHGINIDEYGGALEPLGLDINFAALTLTSILKKMEQESWDRIKKSHIEIALMMNLGSAGEKLSPADQLIILFENLSRKGVRNEFVMEILRHHIGQLEANGASVDQVVDRLIEKDPHLGFIVALAISEKASALA